MTKASSLAVSASISTQQHLAHVSIVNGEAFVWSAASVAYLRRHYGIVGMLTGSLPLIPQQNAFLGVPLQLFEEEVVYLLRKRAVILVDDTKAHDVQSLPPEALKEWHEKRYSNITKSRRAAAEEAKEAKEASVKRHAMSEAALLKKQQREERKHVEAKSQGHLSIFQGVEGKASSAELDEVSTVSHVIRIESSSEKLNWYNVRIGDNAFDSLSSAAKSGLWDFPKTADQRAKCAAFEALRAKGYYLGKGLRFGGDFVVYPGDPLRYHSHFTATVQTTAQSPISAHEIIAAGRLGTAVKKAHLLCSVDLRQQEAEGLAWQERLSGNEDDVETPWGQVDFISLTWAGFGV